MLRYLTYLRLRLELRLLSWFLRHSRQVDWFMVGLNVVLASFLAATGHPVVATINALAAIVIFWTLEKG
jgi:hypothetical protein